MPARSAATARKGSGAPRVAPQVGAKAKGAKSPHWDDVETLVWPTQSPHTARSQPPVWDPTPLTALPLFGRLPVRLGPT